MYFPLTMKSMVHGAPLLVRMCEHVGVQLGLSQSSTVLPHQLLDLESASHVWWVVRIVVQTPATTQVQGRLSHQAAQHATTNHHSINKRGG